MHIRSDFAAAGFPIKYEAVTGFHFSFYLGTFVGRNGHGHGFSANIAFVFGDHSVVDGFDGLTDGIEFFYAGNIALCDLLFFWSRFLAHNRLYWGCRCV